MPQLEQVGFILLGHFAGGFPFPKASTREELEANVKYCRSELSRMDSSIAQINSHLIEMRMVHSLKAFLMAIERCEVYEKAQTLTELMDKLLESLQPLACRVLSTMDDAFDFLASLHEAKVSADTALQAIVGDQASDFCKGLVASLTECDTELAHTYKIVLEEHRYAFGENAGLVENWIGMWDNIRANFSDRIPGRELTGEK